MITHNNHTLKWDDNVSILDSPFSALPFAIISHIITSLLPHHVIDSNPFLSLLPAMVMSRLLRDSHGIFAMLMAAINDWWPLPDVHLRLT